MNVMNSTPPVSGGVSWKRYEQSKSTTTTGDVLFTFPNVTDWDKCAICISGTNSTESERATYSEPSINRTDNTITVSIRYARITCAVYQFIGNVKVIYKFVETENYKEGYKRFDIPLGQTVNPEQCILLSGRLVTTIGSTNSGSSIKPTGMTEQLAPTMVSIYTTASGRFQMLISMTVNVVELLD